MRIRQGPGNGIMHCCECGSMQYKFDEIQHAKYCLGIRADQEFTKCPWHNKKSSKRAMASIIFAIDNWTE